MKQARKKKKKWKIGKEGRREEKSKNKIKLKMTKQRGVLSRRIKWNWEGKKDRTRWQIGSAK